MLAVVGPTLPLGIFAATSVLFGIAGCVLCAGTQRLARLTPDRLVPRADDATHRLT